jgi:hypothetical protein
MDDRSQSIFNTYYSASPFVDRYATDPAGAVDVLIPVVHTTELWQANLRSLYREIPIARLLIGDGGCTDDSIKIVKGFPRVEVLDHRAYASLGYSLRKLIEAVTSEWFVYVHSDVYLPPGWFDAMARHQSEYDWFGCPQRITALVEYANVDRMFGELRPYAGSQMGRARAFRPGVSVIDDDFVYRQEDYVLAGIVERAGFRQGWVEDTFHYHQLMRKESRWGRKLKRVAVEVEWSREEILRASAMQVRGLLKYLVPTGTLRKEAEVHLHRLCDLGAMDAGTLELWLRAGRPEWRGVVSWTRLQRQRRLRRGLEKVRSWIRR